ncbi:ribokinase [Thiofilum flexile]|uniref:ribokinase n=1 Tax=Thiofilum flexile TaxID=125627 RepID=UPI00037B713D|nr:ribokinase [Thiofilum flexile]
MAIFNYGSINIDHVYRVPHLVQPGETLASRSYQTLLGGKGANQSIALARAGAKVQHIGRYGEGDEWVLAQLESAGVDCHLVTASPLPTGHAIIQVDDQAENAIVLYRGANHSFTPTELPDLLKTAQANDWLLLQNECSCTAEMITLAAQHHLKVAFNPAPMTAQVAQLPLESLNLLIINKVEAQQLLQLDTFELSQITQVLSTRYPSLAVIITLGDKGVVWVDQHQAIEVPALPVQAVDTTAAGDTFIGFALAALSRGQGIQYALELGCRAAALCVQRAGAAQSIPTLEEVLA